MREGKTAAASVKLLLTVFILLEVIFVTSNISLAHRSPLDRPSVLLALLILLVYGYSKINYKRYSLPKLIAMNMTWLLVFGAVFAANKLLIVAL